MLSGTSRVLLPHRRASGVSPHDFEQAWAGQGTAALSGFTQSVGYLIAGRIGTGKTFIVQCWAGEIGIPCVVLKNFRDRWVGATESNLEKIFAVLRAVGQVVVFVDEADQAAGKREGGDSDSGLSGRIYRARLYSARHPLLAPDHHAQGRGQRLTGSSSTSGETISAASAAANAAATKRWLSASGMRIAGRPITAQTATAGWV